MAVVESCLCIDDLLLLSDRVLFVDHDKNTGAWMGAFDNGHRLLTGPTQVGVAMGYADFVYRSATTPGWYSVEKARKPSVPEFLYGGRAWLVPPVTLEEAA